ncbi:MAG: tetratricopeptide repeat protein [Acidobacteriaceae bacterium]|nr:tetratricopeptide repeat protein [Acidobacteriaceae bacterium]
MTLGRLLAMLACGAWMTLAAEAQDACARGDQALAAAQWSQANDAYQICLQSNPSFAVYSNRGVALAHMGRMEDAIASYDKALSMDPSNSKIEFNLTVVLIREEKYAAAVDHLTHLERTGNDVRYDELLALAYYHLQSYSLAARVAERVYAKHPEDPANELILGSTYERMHLYEKALPLITAALASAGSDAGHLILAQTLNGLHRYTEAEAELQALAAVAPDFPQLHEAMGEMYVGTERSPQAEIEFEQALKEDPNDFEANYFLGRLKRFDGDLPEAEQYLAVADRLHPDSSDVKYERAEIALKQHRFADAVPLLEAVIQADPDQAQAYLMLSEAYQRTGRRADAQREGELYNLKRKESHEQRAEQQSNTSEQERP